MLERIKVWIKTPELLMCLLKIIVSLIFATLFVVRIIYPELNIDAISIILLILAMFPWYSQNVKALELNGIGKVELVSEKEKEELEEKVAKVATVQTIKKEKPTERYSFYNLRYTDQKLALAGLRIEIEKELHRISQKSQIRSDYKGVAELTKVLVRNEMITHNEYTLIRDIIGVLNKAVHSRLDDYKEADFEWVFEIGLEVLESMKQR